jgi:hypothetical protein
VRTAPDNYFVRLNPEAAAPPPTRSRRERRKEEWEEPTPRRRRRRRRINGRLVFTLLLLAGLGSWLGWAMNQPGGVSGTINGFIEHVRGDVQDASGGQSLGHAAKYFNEQYANAGQYPRPTDDQLSAAGISVDVDIQYCGSDAVVLRTLTVSRLLLDGKDLGELSGRRDCPADLNNPSPWHASN